MLAGIAVIGLVLQSAPDWYRGLHLTLAVVAATYVAAGSPRCGSRFVPCDGRVRPFSRNLEVGVVRQVS
nr:hypothetical protein GCM10020063_042440 [Dactylosporangium thailandense]